MGRTETPAAAQSAVSLPYSNLFIQQGPNPCQISLNAVLNGKKMHPRFLSANQELRCFLHLMESVTDGTRTVTDEDLNNISMRLMTLAPQIGDASRSETLDSALQNEVAEYVKNIGALQGAMKEVRSVMMATRAQLEAKDRSIGGLPDLIGGHQQPTVVE